MTAYMPYRRNEIVLRADGVATSLDGRTILRDVTFEIRNLTRPGTTTGQIVAVLGPSGIGKTRLLRVLAGLDAPTAGKVLVDEKPVERGTVGVVFQSYPLFEHRTVLGNLLAVTNDRARAKALLEQFALDGCASRYPAQLSGGQRQRVAILQQVLGSRRILLMDEPLSGLDPVAVDCVCALIREIASLDDLNTIVLTTHNIDPVLAMADTILLLGGEPATIRRTYDLIERGLTWRSDAEECPEFAELRKEIRYDFRNLTS